MKWANAVGKTVPRDLLNAELLHTFDLHKQTKQNPTVSVKPNKMGYACTILYVLVVEAHLLYFITILIYLELLHAFQYGSKWTLTKIFPKSALVL